MQMDRWRCQEKSRLGWYRIVHGRDLLPVEPPSKRKDRTLEYCPRYGVHYVTVAPALSVSLYSKKWFENALTCLACASLASAFALASLFWSFCWRFSLFCFRATSSRFILFLIEDGSKRLAGMIGGVREAQETQLECKICRT